MREGAFKSAITKQVGGTFFQPKLTVNAPNDPFEREADAMADQVVQTAPLQRKCAACEAEEKEQIQAKEQGSPPTVSHSTTRESVALPSFHSQLKDRKGQGNALSPVSLAFMNRAFGADFSQVRIHTDARAASMSNSINARAFTHRSDIYFNNGQFQPQSQTGKRLLAHELTHVVQQGHRPTPQLQRDGPPSPDADLLENPYVLSEERLIEVRESVLSRLRRNDGTGFTARIRSLSATEASSLLDDAPFWTEIRRIFRGRSLWAVYTILYFNNHLREPDLRLSVNFRAGDPRGFMDALALVMLQIRPQQYYDFLREAAAHEFAGSPMRAQVLQMIDNHGSPGAVERLSFDTRQIHYEENADGDWALDLYGRRVRRMTVYESGGELRVIIRIRFVSALHPDQSYYMFPDSSTPDRWRSAIERFWNGKFVLNNGSRSLRFVVVPMFYYEDAPAEQTVKIMEDDEQACPRSDDPGRANAGCWFTSSSNETVAHEFGHLLGAADEYNLPGSIAEIPAATRGELTAEDLEFTTMEGITGRARRQRDQGYDINSLMGRHSNSTRVYARHIERLVRRINGRLPAGTPPFRIEETGS